MIYKGKFLCFLLVFYILITGATPSSVSGEGGIGRKKVLIIYDQRSYFGYKVDMITSLRELIGHFDLEVAEKDGTLYQEGELNKYDYLFVVGVEGRFDNQQLIADLRETEKTLCWLGAGVEVLIKENKKISLEYQGKKNDLVHITYKGEEFDLGAKREFLILNGPADKSRVYAWLDDGRRGYPYIVREKNFWYVSRLETGTVLFYILADVLYDIFQQYNFEDNKVFIRIEDVHMFREPERLAAIGEYLHSKDIPFMVALIPAYVSVESSYVNLLSSKKDFVEAIRYLQKLGGSIVLHGYTHQHEGTDTSGEGFEFWDGVNDRPLAVDMEEWMHRRIGEALTECVKNGLYPLAFEAPHYAVSQEGYKILKNYFSTYVGQVQTSDSGFTTTEYPYQLYNTELFHRLVPENLGFINPLDSFTRHKIVENLRQVSIVRGYTAGVFYHPYIDLKYLQELVEELLREGVEFYDLKKERNWVKWEEITIESNDGEIIVTAPGLTKKEKEEEPEKAGISTGFVKMVNILIAIVTLCCLIFLVVLVKSKSRSDRQLFS